MAAAVLARLRSRRAGPASPPCPCRRSVAAVDAPAMDRCRLVRRRRRRCWRWLGSAGAGVAAGDVLEFLRGRSRNSTSLARIAGSIGRRRAARAHRAGSARRTARGVREERRASGFDLRVRHTPVCAGRDQLVEVADQLLHLVRVSPVSCAAAGSCVSSLSALRAVVRCCFARSWFDAGRPAGAV